MPPSFVGMGDISQSFFSDQALRIKTKSYACNSMVSNITYAVSILNL